MKRIVQKEVLDQLQPEHPAAAGSRRDLVRLNWWMGNPKTAARALSHLLDHTVEPRLLELGGGDGRFFLELARRLKRPQNGTYTLLDRQPITNEVSIGRELSDLGWRFKQVIADVRQWAAETPGDRYDAIVANLFLHHFQIEEVKQVLAACAARCHCVVAIEPRRSLLALAFSRLVGLIGCNAVTRHDAVVSVRAGFSGRQLSGAWPASRNWILHEHRTGLFSHLLIARRGCEESPALLAAAVVVPQCLGGAASPRRPGRGAFGESALP